MSDHPSFEDLSAYFDGEAMDLKKHVDSCGKCMDALSAFKADQDAILSAWKAPVMPGSVSDLIPESVPWWTAWSVSFRQPAIAFAAVCLALLLWNRSVNRDSTQVEIPADLFIAAHNQYELTLPLAPTEKIMTEMPRGLALGIDPDRNKEQDVY